MNQSLTPKLNKMGSRFRGALAVVSLVLISSAILLMIFVVLSGVSNVTPFNKTWFLRADTSNIVGSGRPVSQWTYFYICGDKNQDCGKAVPALPVGYAWVGAGRAGVPVELVGLHGKGTTSTYYYYLWRFGWVFYLIGFFFVIIGWFVALLGICSRLASGLSGLLVFFGLFWYSIAAGLMTVVFVKMRNSFLAAGYQARVGIYAFSFTWGAWAALFLSMVLLFIGTATNRGDNNLGNRSRRAGVEGSRFSRRQRNQRGAFADGESTRRVKDEY